MGSYWTNTETYESLKGYINMNFDGLRDSIVQMIAGGSCKVNPAKFQNDMTSFRSRDDILTLLVHLGYLTFDSDNQTVFIPNEEVKQEFINAVEDAGWEYVMEGAEELKKWACGRSCEEEQPVKNKIMILGGIGLCMRSAFHL